MSYWDIQLECLTEAKSIENEIKILQGLHTKVKDYVSIETADPFETVPEEVTEGSFGLSAQCIVRPSFVFSNQEKLDDFVTYIFRRRFGWSEQNARNHKQREDSRDTINGLLDSFIIWFGQEELSEPVLASLINAIKKAHSHPVVRHQMVIHLMDWLKGKEFTTASLQAAFDAMILALTDIWSAIRNTCVSRLNRVIENFTLQQLKGFFNQLVQICQSSGSTWQAKEGAIAGINTVIRRFQWVTYAPNSTQSTTESPSDSVSQPEYFLRFGAEELGAMPDFIANFMRKDVFMLLSHSQLSIRENTIKAYSSYIARSEFKEALTSFNTVVDELRKGTNVVHLSTTSFRDTNDIPPKNDPLIFLDAYEAEGYLGICINLIKHISSGFLLPNWPMYLQVFCAYLMHPASTVRQTTSIIFKFLVAKDSSNPAVLKLVLRGLSSGWSPNTDHLLQNLDSKHTLTSNQESFSSFNLCAKAEEISSSWQWREGRLLAYELICQFLIKNHWLYTFGSSQIAASQPLSPRQQNALSKSGKALGLSANEADLERGSMRKRSCSGSGQHALLCKTISAQNPTDVKQKSLAQHGSLHKPHFEHISHHRERSNSFSKASNPMDIPHRIHLPPPHLARFSCSAGAADLANLPESTKSHARLPTMSDYGSPLQTLVRHYSYYNSSLADSRDAHSDTMSLLTCAAALDQQGQKSKEMRPPDSVSKSSNLNTEGDRAMNCGSLSDLLEIILHQTVESLVDGRWELRRMGQQLFPCLVELLLWYDIDILQRLWLKHLSESGDPKVSLLSYAACLSLQLTVNLCASLQTMNPEMQEMNHGQVKSILNAVKSSIPDLIDNRVMLILKRSSVDKMSLTAMHTILIAHTHFMKDASNRDDQFHAMCATWWQIFKTANPDEEISCSETPERSIPFVTPPGGLLSCCIHPAKDTRSAAQQVEKSLLHELSGSIHGFMKTCPILHLGQLLPLFVCYLRLYSDLDNIVKMLLDSLSIAVTRCQHVMSSGIETSEVNEDGMKFMQGRITLAMQQWTKIIRTKSLDVQTLRQSLELCCQMALCAPPSSYLTSIFEAVSSRSTVMTVSTKASFCPPEICASNHITVFSPPDDEDISEEDDDEVLDPSPDSNLLKQGSHLLNLSGASSASVHLSPRGSVEAVGSTEGSDWDDDSDWSEEDGENNSAVRDALSEFLKKIKEQMHLRNDRQTFDTELNHLHGNVQKQILDLLH